MSGHNASEETQDCIECGVTKPLSGYYKNKRMAKGVAGVCKECHKARMRERQRRIMADPGLREKERERCRRKFKKNGHRWEKTPRYQNKTRKAVRLAIKRGDLTPDEACHDCGHDFTDFRREAHHEDYSKPLDVVWLCSLCHGKRHRKYA